MNIQTNAALHQDVMAIGVNYRLGAWGWFYLNEKEDDQEWQGKGSTLNIKGFTGQARQRLGLGLTRFQETGVCLINKLV